MRCAVKRRGFYPDDVRQIAEQNDRIILAVLCLANESCVIGCGSFTTLKNCLIRRYRKYARIFGAHIDLATGEVLVRSFVNRRYANRLSDEVLKLDTRKEILDQLERRLWWYLAETEARLWIAGLEEELALRAKLLAEREERRRKRYKLPADS
ncbi:hypothetical protein FWG76_00040 [Candidatus Saccharibacteria bacterium]|nr:hypothetical protein [Candidatus Saccharibacteria bacterium]